MLLTMLNQDDLLSKTSTKSGVLWRAVDRQSATAFINITHSFKDAAYLENEVEKAKPQMPKDLSELPVFLQAPFRYPLYHKDMARFRKAGLGQGTLQGSTNIHTAVAECAFNLLLFFIESSGLDFPLVSVPYNLMSYEYKAALILDLESYLSRCGIEKQDFISYNISQDIADKCREANIDGILSHSLFCPRKEPIVTLFSPSVVRISQNNSIDTWYFTLDNRIIKAQGSDGIILEFPFEMWAFDERVRNYLYQ